VGDFGALIIKSLFCILVTFPENCKLLQQQREDQLHIDARDFEMK